MKQVIVALGLVDWEAPFVSGLGHPMLGLTLQRRCVDGVDIRAAVQVVTADVVIVSDYTPRVDQDLMNELSELQIKVIAIGDDEEYWRNLGVDHFIPIDHANPLNALTQISATVRDSPVIQEVPRTKSGELIAVSGFGGSCGRSTAVKEIGWHLSKQGHETLLVDADTYGPSLHQELGIEPNGFGLLEACRAMEKRSATDLEFQALTHGLDSKLSLLAGLPRTSRWTDLRVPALRSTWERALSNYEFVLTDIGGVLEVDHSLLHEASLPRRHAAALTSLAEANTAIVCARADAIGISRLVKGYLEFAELFSKTDVSVILWGTTNAREEADACRAISRHTGIQMVSCIPLDWKSAKTSLELGKPISSLDSKGIVAEKFSEIAEVLISKNKISFDLKKKQRARSGFRSKRAA